MIEAEKFKSPTPMQKIERIKFNPQEIKIDRSWIPSLANPTKINKKNIIKIDKNGKLTIKPQLLRRMSVRSKWREGSSIAKEDDTMSMTDKMSGMSFEHTRYNIDKSMGLDRKVIKQKTRTTSESIYKDELNKNLTVEIWYKATSTKILIVFIF